jgi:hypothetical protein
MPKKTPPKTKSKKIAKPKTHVKAKMAELAAEAAKEAAHPPKVHKYRSFRLQTRIKTEQRKPLVGSFRLFWRSLKVLRQHWKPLAGIVVIYALLNWAFVHGFNVTGNFDTVKGNLGHMSTLSSSASLFMYMLGSSSDSSNVAAGSYQFVLMVVTSLALIWTLRQVFAGHKTRARDGFYRGMTPLVPFVLVGLVVLVQLLPLALGIGLYGSVIANGVAAVAAERFLWGLLAVALSLVSLYWVASSIFALYIVTLPDMTPLKALRSARDLVRHRRLLVLRRVLFLPAALLVVMSLIIMPLIAIAPPLALWVFFLLSNASIGVIHSYMYSLYRELL